MSSQESASHRASKAGGSNPTESITTKTIQRQSTTPDAGQSGTPPSQDTQQFEVDITSRRQFNELQRLEQTHGDKVHDWLAEGMPRQAMGSPEKMSAFRTRKNSPVPWNVEAQNAQSVQRSAEAAADTSRAGKAGVPDSVREVLSSTGHSLEGSVQRKMEDRMGESFGDVQVHTGLSAANACEDINARAFTVGNHIAFNRGEYDPESQSGQHTIAHELAHVRQQTGGAVSMLPQDGLEIDPDPQLEQEAEATAQRVMAGDEMGIQRLGDTAIHVQRRASPQQYQGLQRRNQLFHLCNNIESLRSEELRVINMQRKAFEKQLKKHRRYYARSLFRERLREQGRAAETELGQLRQQASTQSLLSGEHILSTLTNAETRLRDIHDLYTYVSGEIPEYIQFFAEDFQHEKLQYLQQKANAGQKEMEEDVDYYEGQDPIPPAPPIPGVPPVPGPSMTQIREWHSTKMSSDPDRVWEQLADIRSERNWWLQHPNEIPGDAILDMLQEDVENCQSDLQNTINDWQFLFSNNNISDWIWGI